MKPAIGLFSEKIAPYARRDQERILQAALLGEEQNPETLHHHLGTAAVLIELNLDADSIIAALLRDCLKFPADAEAVKRRFGRDVLPLAEDVARVAGISATGKTLHEADLIRKMLFAMVRDIRVILIKLADALHTMRTLDFFPQEGRKAAAQECLDIYAPLADRLGISWLKDELEDLCLKHLNRDAYLQIKEIVALKRGERRDFLRLIQATINTGAKAAGIAVEVQSRAKHFYSIYQKMRRRNKTPEDLYDLFGIRLLCDTIDQCYTLLGMVHRLWKPLDGRFKDYIAMPKSNGYRSLHTTVFVNPEAAAEESGKMLEIQIRTREMHTTAEYGVAGHWLYKQRKGPAQAKELPIVNRLRDWHTRNGEPGKSGDSQLFLEDIKRELLKGSIYVFTPRGKVVELPAGATPLDFAFQIHTSIGEHCQLARADGVIVPLNSKLKNTQVIEILTSAAARPTENWLRSVRTSKARNKIRSWLLQNDESFSAGTAKKEEPPKPRAEAAGDNTAGDKPAESEKTQYVQHRGIFKVKVDDEKNMMIRFAGCCKPILGDPIVGYVSRGRGIIIHRTSCGNIGHIPDFEERKIEAQWENTGTVLKRFRIEAKFRENLFSEIEGVIRKFQGHLIEGRLDKTETGRLTGYFAMELETKEDVRNVLKHLRGIPSVSTIQGLG
ncbi:MAG: HD domain-containing protein [Spirochaetaceae bacterium]|nr:HD domain-containing protein [Spirochaetaceae bacterium]